MDTFHGRLYGSGLDRAGVDAHGRWAQDALLLASGGDPLPRTLRAEWQLQARGFNDAVLALSWREGDQSFELVLDAKTQGGAFHAGLPQALQAAAAAARRQGRATHRRPLAVVLGLLLMGTALVALLLWGLLRLLQAWPDLQVADMASLLLAPVRAPFRGSAACRLT